MVFLSPQPDEKQLRDIYGSDYYEGWGITGDDESAPQAMKQQTFRRQLSLLARHMAPGKILDVGCATGFSLEVSAAVGWDVYGVELSNYAAELARRKFGEHIFNGTLEQAHYPNDFFDVVTLTDLLEHVPILNSFLSEVRRVLRPNGILLIVTPDVSSLTACIMGSRWSHYKEEHLHYFSRKTLTQLLTKHGFSVEYWKAAAKHLNISYVTKQFKVYPHSLMTPLCKFADDLLPAWIKNRNIPVRCGEMLVLARNSKNSSGEGA